MLGSLFTQKFLILLAVIAVCVFVYRAFCRFLCPLGAIYGLFAKVAVIGVRVDLPKCIDCGRCVGYCKMDIRHVSDHECIHCGECIDVCPTQAISFKAGKITFHGSQHAAEVTGRNSKLRMKRIAAWSIAILLLMSTLIYINLTDTASENEPAAVQTSTISQTADVSDLTVGKDAGMRAPDFSAPVYGQENPFRLSDHRGKTVVVNFWATWCSPCCEELPYFDELHRKYGDTVSVVAVHSDLVTDDVEAYLAKYTYQMPFALDETGDIIRSFGGSTMLPQTVIIDPNGVITYNAVGSLTLDKLESLVTAAALEK